MEWNTLDLLDLISERHMMLRHELAAKWNETADVNISNAEWYILAKIMDSSLSLAELSRRVNNSRQATHKMVKSLEQKRLLIVLDVPQNKKEKRVQLTEQARHYYAQYEALKRELEQQVEQAIGAEHYAHLMHALQMNWD